MCLRAGCRTRGLAGGPFDDGQRLVGFLEAVESCCGNAEYDAEDISGQLRDRGADADVVFAFLSAGVEHDQQVEVLGAFVFEVVQ